MKYNVTYLFTFLLIAAVFTGCGPSEEEKRQEEARQDSLEQVRQQRLEQQRQDSLAKVQNREQTTGRFASVSFSEDGRFAVHVESWRSQQKAQSRAEQWKERGFNDVSVVKHGNEETGDVWFRVRLGRLDSREAAQRLQESLQEEYQADSWIATI